MTKSALCVLLIAVTACSATPTPAPSATPLRNASFTPAILAPTATPPGRASFTPTPATYIAFFPIFGAGSNATPYPPPVSPTPVSPTSSPEPPPPEPSPTPAWPPTLSGQTTSKLGVLALNNSDPYFFEFIRRVHPRVVKGINDVSWIWAVKQDSPDTITLGILGGKEETWVGTTDPAAAANNYVATNLATYRQNPSVDYWEAWNEYNPATTEQMQWYAQFEAARVCAMQASGLHGAVGSFAVGWPATYDQMILFLPALEAAHKCGGIFTLHEYNGPTMACDVAVDTPNIIPGAPALNVPAGTHALRYRLWYEGLLKPRGLGDLPLVISEAGIDGTLNPGACGNPGGGGWKDFQAWWAQQGLGPDGPQAYVNVLAWYDAELKKDPYVLGATLFTAGALNDDNTWHSFDLHEMLIALAYYEAGQ